MYFGTSPAPSEPTSACQKYIRGFYYDSDSSSIRPCIPQTLLPDSLSGQMTTHPAAPRNIDHMWPRLVSIPKTPNKTEGPCRLGQKRMPSKSDALTLMHSPLLRHTAAVPYVKQKLWSVGSVLLRNAMRICTCWVGKIKNVRIWRYFQHSLPEQTRRSALPRGTGRRYRLVFGGGIYICR